MLQKLISNTKPKNLQTFKTNLIHNSDYFDEVRIRKANYFLSSIFDVEYDVKVSKFSKTKLITKNILILGSSIVSLISLAEITNHLMHNESAGSGELLRLTVGAAISIISYFSNRDMYEINKFFNSMTSNNHNNQSIVNGRQVASAYQNMNIIAFSKIAERTVCIIHELVHMLKPNGVTKGNSDRYLATALELYYCSLMNYFIEFNPNFSNHYELGKKYLDHSIWNNNRSQSIMLTSSLERKEEQMISVHENSVREFNRGTTSFIEKPIGYITGFFVGGILARMNEKGIEKEKINVFIKNLASGKDIQESLTLAKITN